MPGRLDPLIHHLPRNIPKEMEKWGIDYLTKLREELELWIRKLQILMNDMRKPLGVIVGRSTSQTIATATPTDLEMFMAYELPAGSWSSTKFTVVEAGIYRIEGWVFWEEFSSGSRFLVLRKNGVDLTGLDESTGMGNRSGHVNCVGYFAEGDEITMTVQQTSGVDRTVDFATMSALWLGILV